MNQIILPPGLQVRSWERLRGCPVDRPAILGITGGIASGKSMISNLFGRLGATVVSADHLARQVVEPGSPALAALVAHFGPTILTCTGELDRPQLARQVFADAPARKVLEQIIHPAIRVLAESRLQELSVSREIPLVVYEAPLLFEAQAEGRVDLILVVSLAEQLQRQRLRERDGLSDEDVVSRVRAQMPLQEKIDRADLVLDNSGTTSAAEEAVRWLYQFLTTQHKKSPR